MLYLWDWLPQVGENLDLLGLSIRTPSGCWVRAGSADVSYFNKSASRNSVTILSRAKACPSTRSMASLSVLELALWLPQPRVADSLYWLLPCGKHTKSAHSRNQTWGLSLSEGGRLAQFRARRRSDLSKVCSLWGWQSAVVLLLVAELPWGSMCIAEIPWASKLHLVLSFAYTCIICIYPAYYSLLFEQSPSRKIKVDRWNSNVNSNVCLLALFLLRRAANTRVSQPYWVACLSFKIVDSIQFINWVLAIFLFWDYFKSSPITRNASVLTNDWLNFWPFEWI